MLSRRRFLRGISGGVITAGAAAAARTSLAAVTRAATQPGPEADFWASVRREFLLDPHRSYMNNGTLGPTPKPVYYTVMERYRDLAFDPGQPNTDQSEAAEEVRAKAAAFIGANADEVALTRNTTEGLAFVLNGLDFEAGDEILMTFHEHPGGLEPCRLNARRRGVVLKEAKWPAPAEDPGVILNAFNDQITLRTRLIMVSHIMFQTGSLVPVKALAALARSKGILTLIDGAHPVGMLRVDVHDLGVDYYAASPHKWLVAPTGTGLLYMRRASQDRVWPTVVTTGWDEPARGAARFDRLSQRAWPLVLAAGAAIDFQNAIGPERIEARVRALQTRLRKQARDLPGISFHTSANPALSGALLGLTLGDLDNRDIVETMNRRHGIWIRTVDYGLNAVRVSTHIYNDEADVDRCAEGLMDCVKNGVIKAPPLPPGA